MSGNVFRCLVSASVLMMGFSHASAQGNELLLRAQGAAVLCHLLEPTAKNFMEKRGGTKVVIIGGKTEGGFENLLNKNVELVIATRKITPEEEKVAASKNMQIQGELLGWTTLGIITHPSNPVNDLTTEQVEKIFCGSVTKWNEVGGPNENITVYIWPEDYSEEVRNFKLIACKNNSFGPDVKKRKNDEAVLASVAENKGSVGIIHLDDALTGEKMSRVKLLGLKKDNTSTPIKLSHDPTSDETYPILMPFYIYYDSKSAPAHVRDFVLFCKDAYRSKTSSIKIHENGRFENIIVLPEKKVMEPNQTNISPL